MAPALTPRASEGTLLAVPRLLRFRIALAALLGVFLIPIGLASLRGLAHVLTCRELVASPFEVLMVEGSGPVVIGSTTIDPDDPGLLCGGLAVEVAVARSQTADVELSVTVDNRSESDWHGSMRLDVAGVRLPIGLGRVDRGEARTRILDISLPDGTTSFGGTLLIGP